MRKGTLTIGTACLLLALLGAGPARAFQWDGNFSVDGNYDGKIDGADNWAFSFLPGPSDPAVFSVNATYTVFFGVDFESAANTISNGDVTFQSLSSITRTYAMNGVLNVVSSLTLDNVDFAQGSLATLALRVREGGTMQMLGGDQSFVNSLTVGDFVDDGELSMDDASLMTNTVSIIGAGTNGGIMTLDNGSELIIAGITNSSLSIGRNDNNNSRLTVMGGSSVSVADNLLMADQDTNTGTALLELIGAGSSLTVNAGDTEIGSNGLSTATLTAGAGTSAAFGGDLRVMTQGTLKNLGSAFTVGGAAQIDGTFEQTGGSTVFNGTADFGSGATFVHTGGSIQFRDATTFGFTQDITIGGPSVPNAAVWDIDADVAYTRRMRLAGDTGTFATVTVADIGGVDAVLRNTGTGGQADLAVGFNGSAQLFISDTGLVDIFDDVILGQNAGSVGNVFVTGDGTLNPTDRSTLRANRNGSGANLFVGIAGSGFLSVAGGGLVEVGNDLVVQSSDTPGTSSTVSVGVDPSLMLASIDTVTIGNDLLIGNVGNNGGTSSGLYWQRDRAQTIVGRTTHVRATGELRADHLSSLITQNLTTDAGSTLDIDGGVITVDGGTATLNHGDLILNGNTSVTLEQGTLALTNGADAVLAGNVIIADAPGEFGRLRIEGAGSTFAQTPGLFDANVGAGGLGQMRILNGGHAEFNRDVNIGQGIGANGTVEVSGVQTGMRSTLVVDGLGDASSINIGANGTTSRLDISNGGLVEVSGGVIIGDFGAPITGNHTLTIGGTAGGFSAELRTRVINASGPTATLEINDGALVVLTTAATPVLTLFINGGGTTFDFNGGEVFTNRFDFLAGSNVNWAGGTLHTDLITGNELVNQGGTLAPGLDLGPSIGSTTVDGDYTQQAGATLQIEIAGTTPGSEHDFVDVNGTLTLAGTLHVLLPGSAPSAGDAFDILDWNTRTGTFDTLVLPGVGNGNTWDLDNLYTTGVIEVIRSGDLNSDGVVGIEDLDILLANWGQTVTPFDETRGDVNGDGLVGTADLQAVQDQFGDTTFPTNAIIPEPGTLALLGLGLGLFGRRPGRCH